MTYSVLRRGNQYDIVDDSNMFIDEWAGKKSEAEVKDHNLNSASSTMDDVVNAGNGEEKNDRTARAQLLRFSINQKIKGFQRFYINRKRLAIHSLIR